MSVLLLPGYHHVPLPPRLCLHVLAVAASQRASERASRDAKRERGHTETEWLIKAIITQREGQDADCINMLLSSHVHTHALHRRK